MNVRGIRQRRHCLDRQIIIRRRAGQPVSVESPRRDSHHRHRLGIYPQRAADDGGIAGELMLPSLIAYHRCWGDTGDVVRIREQPPNRGTKAKRHEITARHKLAHYRARLCVGSIAARHDGTVGETGLHGGKLCKLRYILLQLLIGVGGEVRVNAVVADAIEANAAIVAVVAEPHERVGVRHRQILQEHGVHQGEDGRIRANTERQCEQHCDGKARRLPQLPEGVLQIVHQSSHC
jgi:hypothetical protein